MRKPRKSRYNFDIKLFCSNFADLLLRKMELLNASAEGYIIDFKDLKIGEYHFDYHVGGSLFAHYEGCEVLDGDCNVAVTMARSETMLTLQVRIEGDVEVECDRCLDPCRVTIEFDAPLVIKFSDNEELMEEYDGEVMWLPSATGSVDLSHYIYESIILSLPYQRVHEEGECNPDMLAQFTPAREADEAESAEANFDNEDNEEGEEESVSLPTSELAKLMALKEKMTQK